MTPPQSIEIFFSYSGSEKDEKLRDKLASHLSTLEREKVITAWHDRKISAGIERADEIEKHLNSARIILLLISADFMASESRWQSEVTRAMERHKTEEARIIPVLIRTCDWEEGTPFSNLEPLPSNRTAIDCWDNEDAGFTDVAKGIRKAVRDMISGQQKSEERSFLPKPTKQWQLYIPWHIVRRVQILLGSSLGVTALVLTLRFLGFLESVELFFFDQMMMTQQEESLDKRLLLIQITPEDVEEFNGRKGASLPDKTIAELLKKLLELKPRVIGLDLYRDFPVEKGSGLEAYLKDERIVGICKVPDPQSGSQGTLYPIGITQNQVGFSDVLQDKDSVVRRQVLQMNTQSIRAKIPSKTEMRPCGSQQTTMDSFSFKLTQNYLISQSTPKQKDNKLALGNSVLEPLTSRKAGVYQVQDLGGYQVLLNYRTVCLGVDSALPPCSPHKIAEIKSVHEVLKEKLEPQLVKNNIVIIGVNNIEGVDSKFRTPFFVDGDPDMMGLILQAQMVSQLVSAVKDRRLLLRVWSIDYEILWILAGSWIGLLIAQLYRSRLSLIVSGVLAPVVLYFLCFILFSNGKLWVPFVPPALTLLGTEGVVVLIRFKTTQRSS